MLGTIGGSSCMDGTVISDSVNLAARIESLTKHFMLYPRFGIPCHQTAK